MKKKVAIMTCNIGGIDQIHAPAQQTLPFEFFYYSENNLPFPLPALNNRLKGKYFKTQAHKFLDHDIFIWIDGSVEILSENFVELISDELSGNEIIIQRHAHRNNVYQELNYISNKMNEGNGYLLKRYAGQPFKLEAEFYSRKGMPKDFPLFQCSFFARENNKRMNSIFDQWWDMILRYSNFDQSQFSYVAWRNSLKIKSLEEDNLFVRHKHQ